MRCVEKTVTCVGDASASESVVREAKCNRTKVSLTGECLSETALGE